MKNSASRINILSAQTVAKIAAGEVVERPASVVKELIENSIDAGSTSIKVNIKNAGIDLIEIIDNGHGMSKTDATLAFKQHTTSKIKDDKDLNQIITLGFRGEALSSIAAVADIELLTSNKIEKTLLLIEDSKEKVGQGSVEQGTTLKVKNLFKRVPARKKFLRSEATEFKHITDIFIQHAIAQPQIHFRLTHNGKEVYNLPEAGDLKTRIFDIWGKKIAEKLHEVYFDNPTLKLQGVIGHPEIARRDRSMQFTYLNNRPIKSDLISKAVTDAFHAAMPNIMQPTFFLNIVTSPEKVDVNVHPRKLEVKFSNTQEIYISVKRACDQALSQLLQNNVKQHFYRQNPLHKPELSEIKEPVKTTYPNFLKATSHTSAPKITNNAGPVPNFLINRSIDFTKELLTEESDAQTPMKSESFKFAQFFNTFIIIEREEKLLFIDQHAADERIKYEHLLDQIEQGNDIPIQPMLIPDTVELQPQDFELIKNNLSNFKKIGLEIEPFGNNTVKIAAIPSILDKFNFKEFIQEVLQRELIDFDSNELLHSVVATMACHGSIRAGKVMHEIEINQMVNQLFKCKKPYSCPHGRPIIWEMSKYEIEKKFKRTGFC